MREARIGLLGCGHVGSALVGLLAERRAAIAARSRVDLSLSAVAVRSLSKHRDVSAAVDPGLFTTDAFAVVESPDVDVVVELVGGIEPARGLVLRALELRKPVVTGNKELLANHGAELFAAAAAAGVDLGFEAAVAGGVPLMRALRESLAGEQVSRVTGIVNGTTNYVLTRMAEDGAAYAATLSEAQGLGYAEADPTADVEGFDAAAKAAIIATVVYGAEVVAGDVYHEGISGISVADIAMARRLGYVIKPVAVIEGSDDSQAAPEVAVRVHPAMVPVDHPLAGVNDSFNAVFVEGDSVGELMFYGRGAGGRPTAVAVLGDVIDAAVNSNKGAAAAAGRSEAITVSSTADLGRATVRPIDDLETAYYLNIEVSDRPGVLARVAAVFGERGVSIRSMEQRGLGDEAELMFITHRSKESAVQATLEDLRELDVVHEIGAMIRVLDDEA